MAHERLREFKYSHGDFSRVVGIKQIFWLGGFLLAVMLSIMARHLQGNSRYKDGKVFAPEENSLTYTILLLGLIFAMPTEIIPVNEYFTCFNRKKKAEGKKEEREGLVGSPTAGQSGDGGGSAAGSSSDKEASAKKGGVRQRKGSADSGREKSAEETGARTSTPSIENSVKEGAAKEELYGAGKKPTGVRVEYLDGLKIFGVFWVVTAHVAIGFGGFGVGPGFIMFDFRVGQLSQQESFSAESFFRYYTTS